MREMSAAEVLRGYEYALLRKESAGDMCAFDSAYKTYNGAVARKTLYELRTQHSYEVVRIIPRDGS